MSTRTRRRSHHPRRRSHFRGHDRRDYGHDRRRHGHDASPTTRVLSTLALWGLIIFALGSGMIQITGK